MTKTIIIGASIAGHTAAMHLRKHLNKQNEIVVISPNSTFQSIASNVWISLDRIKSGDTNFSLEKLYSQNNIQFKQAKVLSFFPEGSSDQEKKHIIIEYINAEQNATQEIITYDYLINATDALYDFNQTVGFTPGKNKVYSICTDQQAEQAWIAFSQIMDNLKKSDKNMHIIIGMGHAKATHHDLALDYLLNIENLLQINGLKERVEITWITNEYKLGDFGIDGAQLSYEHVNMKSSDFIEMILADKDIKWITGAGVNKIEDGKLYYETLAGNYESKDFDFAMLIPVNTANRFTVFDKNKKDITYKLFNKLTGYMLVDADYRNKLYDEWHEKDWPDTYQNLHYPSIFAIGMAFDPPHSISKPRTSLSGTAIYPPFQCSEIPTQIIAKTVAKNIIASIKEGKISLKYRATLANMGSAYILAYGQGISHGNGISIIIYPTIPNYVKYRITEGRDVDQTIGDIGTANYILKYFYHYISIYKTKMKPFWWVIGE